MIPHMLTMEGFGSYIKETVVDFDSVDGIFLISGDTGAGKSLILDAVTYALFGRGAGDRTEFVSGFLYGKNRRMKVSFKFEAAGNMYEFRRSVRYPASRKNGASAKSISEASAYIYENGAEKQINDKNTDSAVNKLAEDILKMSLEQFRQIIVLPQGKIEGLLTGSSKDKQELFTDLFGTGEIDRIAAALKKSVDDEKKTLYDRQKKLEAYLFPNFSNIEELEEKTAEKENEHAQLSRKLSELSDSLNSVSKKLEDEQQLFMKFEELKNSKLSLLALEEKGEMFRVKKERLAELDLQLQLLGEYRIYNDVRRELDERISEEKQTGLLKISVTAEKQTAENALTEHKKNEGGAASAKEKAAQLSEYIKNRKITEALKKKWEAAASDTVTAKNAYEKAAEKFEEYKLRVSEAEKAADAFNITELNALSGEYGARMQSMETGLSLAREAEEKYSVISGLKAEREVIFKKYTEAENTQKRLSDEYEAAFEAHMGGLAAELSQNLTEGEKCPVCGSIHHPEPYRGTETVIVSANDLRRKKSAAEKAAAALSEEKNGLNSLDSRISETEKIAEDCLKRSAAYGYTPEGYKQLTEKINAVNSELDRYKAVEDDIKKLRDKLEKHRTSADNAGKLLAEKESTEKLSEQEYLLHKASCDSGISPDTDPERELERLTEIYTAYEKILKKLSDKLSEISDKSVSAEVQYETAAKELEKCRAKYTAAYNALSQKLSEKGLSEKAEEFAVDEKGIAAVEALRRECEEYFRELENIRKKTAQLDKELEGSFVPDIPKRKAELEALEKNRSETNKLLIETDVNLSDLKNRCAAYKKESGDYQKAREVFERKNSFSEMISGNTEMSFSRYVLGVMLDRVLDSANTMLERILDSNYRLYRSTEGKKTTKLGLDINVINYSVDAAGADYPVKELSGGEKFVMSVILGLAIADTVQNRTGGIQVNSMFIDEGFGTLDEETLLQIMDILSVFGRGKKIGIISHVGTLNNILSGFAVTRSAGEGSVIKIRK